MKKNIFILISALAMAMVAKAQVVQHLYLKNGSLLNGYVQQSGDGRLIFCSENATIMIDGAKVDIGFHVYDENSLDEAWAKWASENDAYDRVGSKKTLTLNSITFTGFQAEVDSVAEWSDNEGDDSTYVDKSADDAKPAKVHRFSYYLQQKRNIPKVKVLEKGIKVKYLELSPNTYILSWDDVAVIKTNRRAKNALSGIDCTYRLQSGESVDGQPADETKYTQSLYVRGGLTETFKVNDIVKYTYHPVNASQDIFEQSELLDIVHTTYNDEVRGIVLEQSYMSQKDSENYLLVRTVSGDMRKVSMSEFVSLRREKNPKFNPLFDVILAEGEAMVNRQPATFVGVKEVDEQLALDSLSIPLSISPTGTGSTKVSVEYHLAGVGNNAEAYQLVKVKLLSEKKKVKTYGFTYKDLANSVVRAYNVETSINGTTKAEYMVGGAGTFALYDTKNKRAIILNISQ
ncbi:MAG: hypothetical protein IJ064_00755 [Bacteroidaceae bacterium]|nr:hypothetical protein [Bacteroidaceae bacterium]